MAVDLPKIQKVVQTTRDWRRITEDGTDIEDCFYTNFRFPRSMEHNSYVTSWVNSSSFTVLLHLKMRVIKVNQIPRIYESYFYEWYLIQEVLYTRPKSSMTSDYKWYSAELKISRPLVKFKTYRRDSRHLQGKGGDYQWKGRLSDLLEEWRLRREFVQDLEDWRLKHIKQ